MIKQAAFTIVELLVTLVIMTVLLTLSVVSFNSIQVNARDTEREADVKMIARGLEQRYKLGNPVATADAIGKGAYPGVNEMLHIEGWERSDFTPQQVTGGYRKLVFPGTSEASFYNPAGDFALKQICVYNCPLAETQSLINSEMSGDYYIYEPVEKDGYICCCGGCERFNLYWRKESDGSIQKVRSLHQ